MNLIHGRETQITQWGSRQFTAKKFRCDHSRNFLNAALLESGGGESRAAFPQHPIAAAPGKRTQQKQWLTALKKLKLHAPALQVGQPLRLRLLRSSD